MGPYALDVTERWELQVAIDGESRVSDVNATASAASADDADELS
jgi:hypothetical protein